MAIIPIRAVSWDTPQSFECKPIESTYGKGTVTARTSNGINSVRQRWSIRATVDATAKSEVEAFLNEVSGSVPFEFYPVLGQSGSFTCRERLWNRLGVELGVVLWELSMTVEEWFSP